MASKMIEMEIGGIDRTSGINDDTEINNIRSVGYIKIISNTSYVITNSSRNKLTRITFYDENKRFIPGWYIEDGVAYGYKHVENGKSIIAPDTAKYMRTTIIDVNLNTTLTVSGSFDENIEIVTTNSKFAPFFVLSSELNNLPIIEGQFIVTTDNAKIYVDVAENRRICINTN